VLPSAHDAPKASGKRLAMIVSSFWRKPPAANSTHRSYSEITQVAKGLSCQKQDLWHGFHKALGWLCDRNREELFIFSRSIDWKKAWKWRQRNIILVFDSLSHLVEQNSVPVGIDLWVLIY